ncbi:hypothetical protein EV424DRAFT_1349888 [Suillus variegatus]|nr:hypothetical protein EV424DRAFT_1349888 [Suillus variegatus]
MNRELMIFSSAPVTINRACWYLCRDLTIKKSLGKTANCHQKDRQFFTQILISNTWKSKSSIVNPSLQLQTSVLPFQSSFFSPNKTMDHCCAEGPDIFDYMQEQFSGGHQCVTSPVKLNPSQLRKPHATDQTPLGFMQDFSGVVAPFILQFVLSSSPQYHAPPLSLINLFLKSRGCTMNGTNYWNLYTNCFKEHMKTKLAYIGQEASARGGTPTLKQPLSYVAKWLIKIDHLVTCIFWQIQCQASDNAIIGHLTAHMYNNTSLAMVDEVFHDDTHSDSLTLCLTSNNTFNQSQAPEGHDGGLKWVKLELIKQVTQLRGNENSKNKGIGVLIQREIRMLVEALKSATIMVITNIVPPSDWPHADYHGPAHLKPSNASTKVKKANKVIKALPPPNDNNDDDSSDDNHPVVPAVHKFQKPNMQVEIAALPPLLLRSFKVVALPPSHPFKIVPKLEPTAIHNEVIELTLAGKNVTTKPGMGSSSVAVLPEPEAGVTAVASLQDGPSDAHTKNKPFLF